MQDGKDRNILNYSDYSQRKENMTDDELKKLLGELSSLIQQVDNNDAKGWLIKSYRLLVYCNRERWYSYDS